MTKTTGRKSDVLVTVLPRDVEIGTLDFDRLIAFADTGLTRSFKETEGVMGCSEDRNIPNRYILLVDPRYDTEWVIEEVKATAMIAVPERETNEEKL